MKSEAFEVDEYNLIDPALTMEQLPKKSNEIYQKSYQSFKKWLKQSIYQEVNENTLLEYFSQKAESVKSSTLWSLFSMLKATILVQNNVDIGKFTRLLAWLKHKNKGYVANKPKVFTKEQLQKFLREAPDKIYLMMKVVLIIGVSGGCRTNELTQLTIDAVEDLGTALIVKIPNPNPRSFTVIPEEANQLDCLNIYRKYCNLRPNNLKHRRFFLSYRDGKCTRQVVGIHMLGKIPSMVARYLQLPEAEAYNGHSIRGSWVFLRKTDRFL